MSSSFPVPDAFAHVAPTVPGVRLGEPLGQGGFATVYAGEQISLQRPVAVKIDSRPLHDERNRRRFMREMAAASRISGHPNAVSLIDSGVLPDGRPYLVMERCDGGSLAQVLEREELSAAQAVSIVTAVSSALGAAHEAGVLHRDIKPGNILIDAYGSPRLSDFGLAAIQREGIQSSVTLDTMTPDFAPPEAFTLADPTPSGDVWSMGAVLFTLLTGRGPRRAADGGALSLPKIINRLSVPADTSDLRIPEALRPLLDRALHPDPAQRYRDGNELTEALARVGDIPRSAIAIPPAVIRTPHPASASVPASDARRSGRAFALLALGVTAGVIISAVVLASTNLVPSASSANRTAQRASASTVPSAKSLEKRGAGAEATATAQPDARSPEKASPSPTPAPTPAQVNAQGIPYSDEMPWPLGTCLSRSTSVVGGTSVSQVDCSQADWIVFAGGTFDPATTASSASEAMTDDPQVNAACTSEYAERYGLDLSTSYSINTLGPNDEEWAAGNRGFACVLGRL
ncbi:serine/threonine protein kinase [Actinomyces viscosus]|uniref:non-specific serine/threonine protein kinase n=1 Tax=Actinomyces viscosus TaxID=1656 RepID=A0A448PIP0_ACTVI|nr:serine/threonine-protein kinase [Actinomyces viscosus]TFH52875.1 serine/threonine protein kinase [Actinomyces viscosus]VEI14849.1 Serine/threonine-protein kinase pknK [Actinomyces viscosus]